MKENNHLPFFGVGPIIVALHVTITVIGIILAYRGYFDFAKIDILNIPLKLIGICLICFGIYLNYSAKHKSKLFEMVAENKLITTGVYGIVRNPVYSAVLLMCTGAICIANNLVLFLVPVICLIYMTIILKQTEKNGLRVYMVKSILNTVNVQTDAFLGFQDANNVNFGEEIDSYLLD